MVIAFVNRWQDFVKYGNERPNPQTMIENDRVRVIVAGLKAGQSIPVHPEAAAVYIILEGEGVMTVDDQEHSVQSGSVITVDDNSRRGLEAYLELAFLTVRLA